MLAAVACAATLAATGAGSAATIGAVASGPARSLGEPAAARSAGVSAVAATSFGSAGALVRVWTRRAGSAAWVRAGLVLPAGFGSSYDASAAASAAGPVLVVAGTAPPGESCITNGSVAIANVDSHGRLGAARLVSDQRGTGRFDDRPTVAIGPDGTVWAAWSQGPDSDACQNVGADDRIEVAASRDGGRTFGASVTMPAGGGDSAFGARLAPLPGGRVAVSWTERVGAGGQAVLVSTAGLAQRPTRPRLVLTGGEPPLVLPGASFYDFPAGDIVALPGNRLLVAAPVWRSGRTVIEMAARAPGGQWRKLRVSPPAGADLLLPALGLLSGSQVRLICAVHTRSGDRVSYDWAGITVTTQGVAAVSAPLAALTPALAGPGFFEIGEELSVRPDKDGLFASIVLAGRDGATLETLAFKAPRQASPPAAARSARPARSAAHGRATVTGPSPRGALSPAPTALAVAAAAVVACCAVLLGLWRPWRRRATHRAR